MGFWLRATSMSSLMTAGWIRQGMHRATCSLTGRGSPAALQPWQTTCTRGAGNHPVCMALLDHVPEQGCSRVSMLHTPRGMLFGVYGDIGEKTCGGWPGMQGHLKVDAQTYADWGVDYLKVNCLTYCTTPACQSLSMVLRLHTMWLSLLDDNHSPSRWTAAMLMSARTTPATQSWGGLSMPQGGP